MGLIATDRVAGQWCALLATERFDGLCPDGLQDTLEEVVAELADLLTADDLRPGAAQGLGDRVAALGIHGPHEPARLGEFVADVVGELSSNDRAVEPRRVAKLMGHLGSRLAGEVRVAAADDGGRRAESDVSVRRVFADADVAVVLIDRDGIMVQANPAAAAMGGYRGAEAIVGSHYLGHLSGPSAQRASQLFDDVVEQRSAVARVDVQISVPAAEGRLVSCSLWPVRNAPSGPVSHVVVVGEDITDRRDLNEELRRLAMYDPLTGLPNRAHLTEYLADRVYPIRSDSVGAMLFCDLVGFKSINDTYGHAFGDTVLRSVAVRMRQAIGASDFLARLGGDEFVVAVSRPTGAAEIDTLVARLHRSLAGPVLTPHGTPLRVRATIGFTLVHDDDRRQVETLMHDADIDMYRRRRAQIDGRGPVMRDGVAGGAPATGELSVELLQEILDSAPDLVYVKDAQGRYLFLNSAAAHVKGKPVAEVIGRDDTHFFPIEFASMLQRNDRSIMVGGQPVEFIEKPVVDGVARTFLSKKAPFRDASGRVAGIIGISRDVTAAWASEEDLHRSEARWQFAVDCSGDGIWEWDVQGGAVFYSPTWTSMLGYADDEIGTGIAEWADRIHPADSAECWQRVAEHIRGDNGAFSFDHRLLAHDGTWRQVHCRGRVIDRAADSSPLRIIASFVDVTDRRREADALAGRPAVATDVGRMGWWDCVDPVAGVVDWDDQMYEIYGHPPAFDGTLAGWQALVNPDDRSSTVGRWAALIAETDQAIVSDDFRILRPDGQQRTLRSRAKILRDARGVAERVVGVNWDVTDHG